MAEAICAHLPEVFDSRHHRFRVMPALLEEYWAMNEEHPIPPHRRSPVPLRVYARQATLFVGIASYQVHANARLVYATQSSLSGQQVWKNSV